MINGCITKHTNVMNSLKKLGGFLVVAVLLSACTSLRVASDFDKDVDFKNYKTYNFYEKGLEKLEVNGLDKKRMMAAVDTEMQAKGFTKTANPDLFVNLVVMKRERTDVYDNGFYSPWGWRGGWGWGWGPYWGVGMRSFDRYQEGLFIIDFLDPKTKMHVWHGRGDGFNLDSFKNREERINEGVKEILAQYPPHSSN
ncbi:DUF4136 domain-containing protein [Pedobacter chitinilyticus]|uniref:DUF4136 domain-containing protein n=2 Tax=Pedobacter chitinilyticus TaxID=2233776 RepID=A0A443YWB5_9SPHI|nr:DUF4136 domain-containing protein [Pedobacter chitinilyticus]